LFDLGETVATTSALAVLEKKPVKLRWNSSRAMHVGIAKSKKKRFVESSGENLRL
jgi:hypothetical protein